MGVVFQKNENPPARSVREDRPHGSFIVLALPDHSGLMPANLTTLLHFSVSSAMNLPKSAGDPGITVPPSSASRALILGSARIALIVVLSLSTMSAGVCLGAPTPYAALAS